MASEIIAIYRRAVGLARALPGVLLLPFAAEMLQHAAEIRLGMYAGDGRLSAGDGAVRLAFGAVKALALLATLIFALRWWRFDGDVRRAARPSGRGLKGLALALICLVGGELLFVALGVLIGGLLGQKLAAVAIAILLWFVCATLLLPWVVGLVTEDRAMTLGRSVRAIRPRWLGTFLLWVAGVVPLMAVHYLIGYGAPGLGDAAIWAAMLIDAAIVALLILTIASTYWVIYLRTAGGKEMGMAETIMRDDQDILRSL